MTLRATFAAFFVALASCATTGETPVEAVGSPESHVIVFGFLQIDGLLADQVIDEVRMVQTDPDGPQTTLELVTQSSFFCTDPLPVGSRWKIERVFAGDEEVAVSIDIHPDQPGLFFVGSLEVVADASETAQVRGLSAPSERALLQDLLDSWRGTEWEGIIRSRIQEIQGR
ncbi:MAG TPA: hypothetical protein VL354_14980 [Spirochaetia bacterium]|nr:hypothetical protein [Spirochaetia bacterium]